MNKSLKELVMGINTIGLFRWHYTNKISNKVGLYRGQFPILSYIMEHPGCQQVDIAKNLQVTPASVATSLKRIERSGFVTRKVDEENHRANILMITKLGEEAFAEGTKLFEELDSAQFKDFNEKELDDLRNYIDRILSNLCGEEEYSFEHFLEIVSRFKEDKK